MTIEETKGQAVTAKPTDLQALQTAPMRDFWPRAKAVSDLIMWRMGETGLEARLQRPPTAAERVELAMGPRLAIAARERLGGSSDDVRKVQLATLVLHYPIRQMSEEKWKVWANGYHLVCADVPDEVFVGVCEEWLKTVSEKMPAPADVRKAADKELAWRKLWIDACLQAPTALKRWDDDHRPKPGQPTAEAA